MHINEINSAHAIYNISQYFHKIYIALTRMNTIEKQVTNNKFRDVSTIKKNMV